MTSTERRSPGSATGPRSPGSPRPRGRRPGLRSGRPERGAAGDSAGRVSEDAGTGRRRRRWGPRWWHEVLLIVVFYSLYTLVRDLRGDKPVSLFRATTNARRIIDLERHLNLFHEAAIQQWFLPDHGFIRFWDDYYGTVHFLAVGIVLLLLYFRYPARYRLWRNTLAFTTGLALIGFAFFPLLPPRLLPAHYHFIDTLRVIGGLWSFSSGPVSDVSNQYAAMPSLHTAWSLWCALALLPVIRPWWGKVLALLYPAATIFCVVVTANHYFADALGAALVLAVSYALAHVVTARVERWRTHRAALHAPAT